MGHFSGPFAYPVCDEECKYKQFEAVLCSTWVKDSAGLAMLCRVSWITYSSKENVFLLRQVKHALLSGLLKNKSLRGWCKGADRKVSGSRKG